MGLDDDACHVMSDQVVKITGDSQALGLADIADVAPAAGFKGSDSAAESDGDGERDRQNVAAGHNRRPGSGAGGKYQDGEAQGCG